MDRKNTEKSTANAVRLFNRHVKYLPVVDGITVKTIEDIFDFDHYQLNLVMEAFCENVKMINGKRYKNGSIMTQVNSIQRAINEHRVRKWRADMASGAASRDSLPTKVQSR